MRATITGGAGFLGRKLAERLSQSDTPWTNIRLLDQSPPPDDWSLHDPRLSVVTGDLTDRDQLPELLGHDPDVIYHLASVVSAGAEANFDLGYAVNLLGTIGLLEQCRKMAKPPTVVFTSSLATYGSSAGTHVDDSTTLRPESSYGVQKAACELLINDYTRKGFIDGRVLRLPTVVVRPGKPNLAASGFASGIIREPLSGIDTVCPVSADTVVAVISPRRVVDALAKVPSVEGAELGPDRTLLLPGLPMRISEAIDEVAKQGGDRPIGTVSFVPDDTIQQIVGSWPLSIVSNRSESLGFVGDSSVAAIVRQHIVDELEG